MSVVIPAYNQSAYLRLAIASALGQTWTDLEVVVVDDGSTDDTRAVCESFAGDARLRYLHQDNDGTFGLGARNRAMLESRGEWIALLDQDDVWAPQKLQRQFECLAQDPGADCSFCLVRVVDAEGRCTREQRSDVPERDVYPHLLKRNRFHASTGLFRRSLLSRAGLPAVGSGYGDWQLWLSLTRLTRAAVVREHLCDYRVQPQSYLGTQGVQPDATMRFALQEWRVIQAHRPLIPVDRPECARALRESLGRIDLRFLEAARAAAARRDLASTVAALRMAKAVRPCHFWRPDVLVSRGVSLLRRWLRGS